MEWWFLAALAGAVMIFRALFAAPFAYRLCERKLTLPFPGPKRLRILHLTDLHLTTRHPRLIAFLQSLRTVEADLVLYTGDFVDEPRDLPLLHEALSGLKARYGSFAVFGNHDYYLYEWVDIVGHFFHNRHAPEKLKDIARIKSCLEQLGIHCLSNKSCIVECSGFPIRLVGLDDAYFKKDDVQAAFGGVRDGETIIALSHSLAPYRELVVRGVALVLSGHAHGGQVRLPGVGALVTRSPIPRKLALGINRVGKTTLFASPGLGTGARLVVRFLCPPEATLLDIRFEQAGNNNCTKKQFPERTSVARRNSL